MQRLEEKRDMRVATLVLGVIIILMLVLGFAGFKFLPKLVNMLSNSNRVNTDKNDLIPPPPPALNLSYSATNSATIDLNGQSEPESRVYLTQNGESKGNQTTQSNGLFIFPEINLVGGNNLFKLVAMDSAGNQSPSSVVYTVEYLSKTPEINIESPQDGQTVTSKKLNIKGSTNPQSKLLINGRWIQLGITGTFETSINLNVGENSISFLVSDKAGNETKKEIKVFLE